MESTRAMMVGGSAGPAGFRTQRTTSLDMSKLYWKSRWNKGGGRDYLNAPMNEAEYREILQKIAELTGLFEQQNLSPTPGTTRFDATFLKVGMLTEAKKCQ